MKISLLITALCVSLLYGITAAVLASIGNTSAALIFAVLGTLIALPLFLTVFTMHKKGY